MRFVYWLYAILLCITSVHAQMPDPVDAYLIPEVKVAAKGETFWIAVEFKLEEHWHTYWQNPGAAGLPTTVKWKLSENAKVSDIHWPYPEWIAYEGIVSLAYEHTVSHLFQITVPKNFKEQSLKIEAEVEWLVCTNEGEFAGCYPGNANLTVELPVGENSILDDGKKEYFTNAQNKLPHLTNNWLVLAQRKQDKMLLYLLPPDGFSGDLQNILFFPEQEIFKLEEKQKVTKKDGIFILETTLSDIAPEELVEISGILLVSNGWNEQKHPAWKVNLGVSEENISIEDLKSFKQNMTTDAGSNKSQPNDEEIVDVSTNTNTNTNSNTNPSPNNGEVPLEVWYVIVLAFAGGIILNAMPCVLPVLSIKILGFVQEAGGDKSKIWKHGLAFTFGVLLSFWVLIGCLFVLRETNLFGIKDATVGWGYQLQDPTILLVMITCFILFALNLFGVFEIGTSLTALGGSAPKKSGLSSSFYTGILATIVATPCSAPFMGTAIGFAMLQPIHIAYAIFSSLALGLAFPYLLISFFPFLLAFVPKPGRWMDSFKKLLAFPLLATAGWLFSVFVSIVAYDQSLFADIIMYSLIGLTCVSFATWVYGRWINFAPNGLKRYIAIISAIVFFCGGFYICYSYIIDMEAFLKKQEAKVKEKPKKVVIDKSKTWMKFSPEKVEAILAEKQPLFIDFTATWCLTCQLNKKAALRRDEVMDKFKEMGVITMSADWTRRNKDIGEFLQKFNRSSVPLYVLYHGNENEYTILPQILTPGIIIEELEKLKK